MKVSVTAVTGYEKAFVAMFISKHTWTLELDREIRELVGRCVDRYGNRISSTDEDNEKFDKWLSTLLKMGKRNITVLRFINIHIMIEGLHRAGQDDVDAHARRFENKIIRSSTRLATFNENEVSDWYRGKILTDGQACELLGYKLPDEIEVMGVEYVKATNGYVRKEYKDDKDVRRGLYMLSIPSNFVSEISLCEWARVYQQRNETGGANPEVKIWAESVMKQLTEKMPMITREYMFEVQN
jgi:hypothetical protein